VPPVVLASRADTADGVAETVGALAAEGVAGVNIEEAWHGGPDPLRDVRDQSARVVQARAAAGDTLFLNVRIDTYLRGVGAPGQRLAETLRRAAAYLDAGADGIFVPGVLDAPTIEALIAGINAPVNVMAGPGAPSVSELASLGVARVSLGTSVAAASYAVVRRAAREVLTAGTYDSLTDALDYGELNGLLA
jgi:2-methylisocitrate lyase-like PEP mutase family enzyme